MFLRDRVVDSTSRDRKFRELGWNVGRSHQLTGHPWVVLEPLSVLSFFLDKIESLA